MSTSTSTAAADRTLVTALRERLQLDTGEAVSLVETHISWVLLTSRLAYKLKKPVYLGFVDFSTLAARKHFCEEEVRLNRRLAPSLYIGVVAVCGSAQAPHLGEGDPIEFAVCMRRFSEDALLQRLVPAGRLELDRLEQFAHRLASFHGRAQIAAPESEFATPDQVGRPVVDALARLRVDAGARPTRDLQTWIFEQRKALRTAWFARQRSGAVRECHGDLHLANVVLIDDQLTAFDCIEFDPALRWIDVMSDVAFLTMDLEAHGRRDLAFRFLDAYLQHSGDYAGMQVLRFYEVYRALVRALVGRFRVRAGAAQPGGPDYLACATRLARMPNSAPRLMLTHGLSGSGKSTMAAALLAVAGAIRIRSDVERKRLFGLEPHERSIDHPTNIYSREATERTFARLAECARTALQAGYPVIVDAAFLRRDERLLFRALAAQLHVPFSILRCRAGEADLRRRIVAREAQGRDPSEATLDVLERQLATQEPLDPGECAAVLDVATDAPVDVDALGARWLALSLPPITRRPAGWSAS
ncbi:polynucleotide kinase [Variovorax sp. PBS-H4]|uniref:bifunctional aminoglycoside phosphotransferase/ATP-binding protein n=1 Tax=Variovorax sp. PBS-H4 TaxID=434008 RepID=UPI0013167CA2|nr:bifunctional aminoglycoside phosphotransferase/ATP-binding protein [Variovorax sp. PBS-H4]VTU35976.1 polynucleotide kinase [Variovorax sp. PBS-H4]